MAPTLRTSRTDSKNLLFLRLLYYLFPKMCFKHARRGGGWVGVYPGGRQNFRSIKQVFFASPDSRNRFFEMAPESYSLGKVSTSSAWLEVSRHRWPPLFSLENNALRSTGSQTLRTQWFGDTFAIPLGNSNTFGSD